MRTKQWKWPKHLRVRRTNALTTLSADHCYRSPLFGMGIVSVSVRARTQQPSLFIINLFQKNAQNDFCNCNATPFCNSFQLWQNRSEIFGIRWNHHQVRWAIDELKPIPNLFRLYLILYKQLIWWSWKGPIYRRCACLSNETTRS